MDKQYKESSIVPQWFVGVVEDRQDPLCLGRVRVRILGRHTPSKNLIPTESLPWSQVLLPANSVNAYPPKEGDQVFGFFMDGTNAQKAFVIGVIPSIPQTAADTQNGFADGRTTAQLAAAPVKPNETKTNYPRNLDEPTTSRLYRNESTDNSIVSQKENRRLSKGEPASTYAAIHPYNNVVESESGHAIEIDDTPNAERLHFYHRSGSYVEYSANGNRVERIQKDKYSVVVGDESIYIKGNTTIYVENESNHTAESIKLNDLEGTTAIQIKNGKVIVVAANEIVLDAPQVTANQNFGVATAATGSFSTPTGQTVMVQDGIITNIF